MVKPDKSDAARERDKMVDRLMDLLGEASVISKNVKLGILDYIVGWPFWKSPNAPG